MMPTANGPRELASIRLRPTTPADLPAMFEMQSDPESNRMAGTKPRIREVFFAVWERHFSNPKINARVIELGGEHGGEIVGSLACFQAEVGGAKVVRDCFGYWIARAHWGKGIASLAVVLFLREEPRRTLHATTLCTNAPSRRILEKHGFRLVGLRMGEETERYVAREVAEFVLE